MKNYSLDIKVFSLFKIIFFYLLLSVKCFSDVSALNYKFITLGNDDAAVKIKIFSSFTCPHCADFHFNIIPKIKKKYVDAGKVQLIFIDFPLDQAAFNASKLLHCVDKNKQINFMDIIYKKQKQWTDGINMDNINNNLKNIVKNLDINSPQFDKCLIDESISDKILNGRIDATRKYSISSTPTIIINEKKLEGSATFKNIEKKVEKII